jgi:tRNA pseudouridine38-40 synthase
VPRYLVRLEYVGTNFHGFQRQPGMATVQGELEAALRVFTGSEPFVRGSGRTDAGVHALGQAAAFDIDKDVPTDRLVASLNGLLPAAISVSSARLVRDGFDPRREPLSREYRYFFLNRRATSALLAPFTCHVTDPLDEDAMAAACALFVGEHDFGAFRIKGGPDEPTVRTVYECALSHPLPEVLCLRVRANAFLYRMVRIMAGAALSVARGRMSLDRVAECLAGEDKPCAEALPARGLFLWNVSYPEDIYLDENA